MKKLTIITIIGILLITTIITAGVLDIINKEVQLTKEQNDAWDSKGYENPGIVETLLDDGNIKICLTGDVRHCKTFNQTKCDATCRDEWIDKDIIMVADAIISRYARGDGIETARGNITRSEK